MTTWDVDAYREYLQSEHWKKTREEALERALRSCQVCNSQDGLDVHHRTYVRIGNELPQDLTVLCANCHSLFHDRLNPKPTTTLLGNAIQECFADIENRTQNDKESTSGLLTGFLDLDAKMAGLQPGELTIVAGASGIGKSALLLNFARNIAVVGQSPIFFVSLEYSRQQMAQNMLTAEARVDCQKFRNLLLSKEDFKGIEEAGVLLAQAKIFIDDSPRQNMMHIAANALRLKQEYDIQAVFVDCLDSIEVENPRDFRQEQIAKISRRLRVLARELGVPVVVSARLNRLEDRMDHRPRLTDLRQSSSVEGEADNVLLLHRPDYYEPGQQEGIVEVTIAKQRNGPTCEFTLLFIKQFMKFTNFEVEPPFSYGD